MKRSTLLFFLLLLFFSLFLFGTLPDTGVTFDEPLYFRNVFTLTNQSLSFQERAMLIAPKPKLHPPFMFLFASPFYLLTKGFLPATIALRLGTLILYLLFLCVVFFFLKKHFGAFAAFASVISLIGMPRVFFHSHLLALDFPVMVLYFASAAFFYEAITTGKKRMILLASITLAALLATKITGFFIFVALFLYCCYLLLTRKPLGVPVQLIRWKLPSIPLLFLLSGLFFLFFLQLYQTPLAFFKYLLFQTTRSGHFPFLLFDKVYSPYHPISFFFTPLTLLVTFNALHVLLALVGIFLCYKKRKKPVVSYLLILFFSTFLFFTSPLAPKVERYFLLLFPFLALFVGIGAEDLSKHLVHAFSTTRKKSPQQKIIPLLLLLFLLASSTFTLWYSHPFHSTYFNAYVGGTKGVIQHNLFQLSDWLANLVHALDWINQLPPNTTIGVHPYNGPYLWYQEQGLLRKDIILGLSKDKIEYLVLDLKYPRNWAWQFQGIPAFEPVYSIRNKQGAELIRILNMTRIFAEVPGVTLTD